MHPKIKSLRFVAIVLALTGLVSSCAHLEKDPTGDVNHNPSGDVYPDPKKPLTDGGVIDDGEVVPISKELKAYLRKNGYSMLNLISSRGVKIINTEGKPVPPTCKLRNGKVPKSCGLKGINIRKLITSTIIVYDGSPRCEIQWFQGDGYSVHASGTEYTPGAYGCHATTPPH